MQAQQSLFDVGRAELPARVLAFTSGANAAREIRGFALARVPVGFSAALINGEGVEELLQTTLPIFADSGAFSEVTMTGEGPQVTHPIADRSWREGSRYTFGSERSTASASMPSPPTGWQIKRKLCA